jgi:uncharacterized repeat protein (TIGR01451 family)
MFAASDRTQNPGRSLVELPWYVPLMRSTSMRVVRSLAGASALALAALVAAPVAPAAAQAAAPAGGYADARGIIVDLTVLTAVPLPGVLGNTPLDPNTFATATQSCPPQVAEPDEQTLLDVPAAPAATSRTVTAMAGANCSANPVSVASAQTEGLTALINAGVPTITADVIRAQANSDCATAPNGTGSTFAGLTIAGQPIPADVPPNTRIDIPGVATVIVNEQHPTATGRGIVVNGLHIIGASPLLRGDLIISHAVSGVVCPNGRGSELAEGLAAPDITFDKDATPTTARGGDTVTYDATVTNTSDAPCDVLSFVDHLNPVFEYVSTSGGFGDAAVDPVPVRGDEGQDVVLRPTDVVIEPGASVTQRIVVRLKADVAPGTYFNNLELFCAVNGDFASGPLAPVTVPAPAAPPVIQPAPVELPRTGTVPLLALGALLLLGAGLGLRRAHG